MRIGIIGCGFVADLYLQTLPLHPRLTCVGVHDRDPDRLRTFASHHGVTPCDTFDALLATDPQIVLNLTNPRDHYAVTKRLLEAGRHVYSEKPLAMSVDEARELVTLAKEKKLELAGAPCTVLSETAQTMWAALRDQVVGTPRLVYAEMDDGMVHRMPYDAWLSASGRAWPAVDEFEVGCTLEHAGYCLTWLCAFFGPARRVTAFSSVLLPDKGTDPARPAREHGPRLLRRLYPIRRRRRPHDLRHRRPARPPAGDHRRRRAAGDRRNLAVPRPRLYQTPPPHPPTGLYDAL